MTQPKRLTEMQMKFAYELVTNEGRKTATECALSAGYSSNAAVVAASKLQNVKQYPLVVQYIGQLRSEYQKNMTLHLKDTYQNLQNLETTQENQKLGRLQSMLKLLEEKQPGCTLNRRLLGPVS